MISAPLIAILLLTTAFEVEPTAVRLVGSDGRVQLLVTSVGTGVARVDVTRDPTVRFRSLDPSVATVDAHGRVRPNGPGQTRIEIVHRGQATSVNVTVEDYADARPVSFQADVAPILAKRGCNAGACHGKATGQNGFRLSLLGSDPRLDYESLVREGRGRRVFPAAPSASLLLKKPTAAIPHGGGRRFTADSPEAHTIARWIGRGMEFGSSATQAAARLEVHPTERTVASRGTQQLRVVTVDSRGAPLDVTHLAQYQSNAAELAAVDDDGWVETGSGVGEAAIMVRFGDAVVVSRITVPAAGDPPQWDMPPSRNLIDPLLFGKLRELGIPPSAECTDTEFARRASLDICGIVPDPDEVAAFAARRDPDKRLRWVERLVERPEYADLFAMKWSAILRNKRTLGPLSQPGAFAFHAWIREALAENVPYDRFVARLLTATGDPAFNPPLVWYRQVKTVEEQVDDTAQVFLGLRLQCARCHHHPFESWGQADYYGFAAFFSRIGRKPSADPVTPQVYVLPEGVATDPLNGRSYGPRVLGGTALRGLGPRDDPRHALVDWLRRPDNPYFARALVNRYWKHFFGRGLVEPEDDLRASNPPSNPALLDALAADFVAHGYDLKRLVVTIASSRAYDRSSLPRAGNEGDHQNFARYSPRRLPAEVLLDAIGVLTGRPVVFDGVPAGFRAVQLPDDGFSSTFLDTFGRPRRESACECERSAEPSLSQGLLLLSSADLQRRLRDDHGRAARLAREPKPDTAKIDRLYRLAYSRPPTADELAACLAHLARRREHSRERYEDLIWALINTKEFLFNH